MAMPMRRLPFVVLLILLVAGSAYGHEDNSANTAGLSDKTGQHVPLDLIFFDEEGATTKLGDIITKPTILTLVYHSCNGICPQMLGALASALSDIKLVPGKDYEVITISFDKDDTPAIAKQKKVNYIAAAGPAFPDMTWRFLTGGEESIDQITKAVGFTYQKDTNIGTAGFGTRKETRGFIHPSALIFLTTKGKINRYINFDQSHYGTLTSTSFSPTVLTSAILDASQGKVKVESTNLIRLCFPGISEQQERFYTVMTIIGAATLFLILVFFLYLRKRDANQTQSRQ